jgi:hypothetical protein
MLIQGNMGGRRVVLPQHRFLGNHQRPMTERSPAVVRTTGLGNNLCYVYPDACQAGGSGPAKVAYSSRAEQSPEQINSTSRRIVGTCVSMNRLATAFL